MRPTISLRPATSQSTEQPPDYVKRTLVGGSLLTMALMLGTAWYEGLKAPPRPDAPGGTVTTSEGLQDRPLGPLSQPACGNWALVGVVGTAFTGAVAVVVGLETKLDSGKE